MLSAPTYFLPVSSPYTRRNIDADELASKNFRALLALNYGSSRVLRVTFYNTIFAGRRQEC